MPSSSPRTCWPIVAAIGDLDERNASIAEVWRRTSALADELGVTRPSYEQVRRLVHRVREIRDLPGSADVVVDFLLRRRTPDNTLDELIERSFDRRALREMIEKERSWRPER